MNKQTNKQPYLRAISYIDTSCLFLQNILQTEIWKAQMESDKRNMDAEITQMKRKLL